MRQAGEISVKDFTSIITLKFYLLLHKHIKLFIRRDDAHLGCTDLHGLFNVWRESVGKR